MTDQSAPQTPDFALPFLLHGGLLRGRLARTCATSDAILERHKYPAAISRLVAEAAALASVLANALKFNGVFTLQAQGSGPVRQLVADVTSDGQVRACATFDETADGLDDPGTAEEASVQKLLGTGHLAFTVDQGNVPERYQGLVELTGRTLSECLHAYFRQSEQLETAIKVASEAPCPNHNGWRAAALMIQRMPVDGGKILSISKDDADEAWRTAVILLGSLTTAELLDPGLEAGTVLHRLFHDEDLSVLPPRPLVFGCRCSRQRVEETLATFSPSSLGEMQLDDGSVSVQCQFCSTEYIFSASDIEVLSQGTTSP
ncbi:Hsp33 family molecular chaperone HslO [Haematospirillum sp. H1815]|uniref:Hsp33 family molecular chaperone HslO n=1 Tax=Haematospirillum sp. H1815 TaxID=2723108 RepID=UPI00143BE45E|nr:Hsp33 family molecular chaperone HslO [Haematospirillum sp. H1815]NKD77524.1 Hsp33 family molecular chaperone HslO [Haematospirillum sp. H1815]